MYSFSLLLATICVLFVADAKGEDKIVDLGDNTMLQCILPKTDECYWILVDKTVIDSSAVTLKPHFEVTENANLCQLKIKGALAKDSGLYHCGQQKLEPITLAVYVKANATYIAWDNGTRVDDGQNEVVGQSSVNLTCVSAYGHPDPKKMTWTVNEKIIEGTENISIVKDTDGTLIASLVLHLDFKAVKQGYALVNPQMEKTVKCTVQDVKGEEQTAKNVFVTSYNTTTVELTSSTKTLKNKETAVLTCDADGIPPPTDYTISNVDKDEIIAEERTHTVSQIGKYQCSVKISDGSWKKSNTVEIADGNSGSTLTSNVWVALCLMTISVMSLSR